MNIIKDLGLTIDDIQYKGSMKTFFLDCDSLGEQHIFEFDDEDGEKIEYKCTKCDKKSFVYKENE